MISSKSRFICLVVVALVGSGCSNFRFGMLKKDTPLAKTRSFDRELSFARLSERQNKMEAATKVYEAILEEEPSNAEAHHRLGVIAAKRGQLDAAIEHLNRAEQNGMQTSELLNDIGYVYYLKKDLDAAERITRQALQADSKNRQATNNLGLILADRGNYEDALALFRRVVSETEALANIAYCQTQKGHFELAEQYLHRSLEVERSNRPAAEALVQLTAHMNKLARQQQAATPTGGVEFPPPAGLASHSFADRAALTLPPMQNPKRPATATAARPIGPPVVSSPDPIAALPVQTAARRVTAPIVADGTAGTTATIVSTLSATANSQATKATWSGGRNPIRTTASMEVQPRAVERQELPVHPRRLPSTSTYPMLSFRVGQQTTQENVEQPSADDDER